MSLVPTEPGDYVVTTGMNHETGDPITHEFDNVVFEYADEGLRVVRGGTRELVAHFRWWESILKVDR